MAPQQLMMQHRIYDVLTLIANIQSRGEEDDIKIKKMIEYHKDGFLLGPSPAFRAEEENE